MCWNETFPKRRPQAVGSGGSRQEVVFHNGQFVVEKHSSAADLIPDISTAKRVHGMLQHQFDKCALCKTSVLGGRCHVTAAVAGTLCLATTCCSCCRSSIP